MKKLILLAIVGLFVVACKPPQISTVVYLSDVLDVAANTSKIIVVPIVLELAIMDKDKCQKDVDKILPAVKKFHEFGDVVLKGCFDVSGEMHDIIRIALDAPLTLHKNLNATNAALGLGVIQIKNSIEAEVHLIGSSRRITEMMKMIDANYAYRTIKLDDIGILMEVNNDLRSTKTVVSQGTFMDGYPAADLADAKLKRRGTVTLIPSDVKQKAFLRDYSMWLFSTR